MASKLAVSGITKLIEIENRLSWYQEMEEEAHMLCVGALSGLHVLFLGDPGTGKSALVSSFVKAFKFYSDDPSEYFRKLMSAALPPDEIFGSYDLKLFEQGVYRRNTKGFFPRARIAFFDEIFKSNDVNNNTLLDGLDEQRRFRNGDTDERIPLEFAVAASNEMYDDNQDALCDRFPLKKWVESISEKGSFFKMLKNRAENSKGPDMSGIDLTIEELHEARKLALDTDVDNSALEILWLLRSEFSRESIPFSDRKANYALDIVRAEATLNGRESLVGEDFAILQHVLWNDLDASSKCRQIILRVASPAVDNINTAISSAKQALDNGRKALSGLHPNATENERILEARDFRQEIKSILEDLEDKLEVTNENSKTGKLLVSAIRRVKSYRDKLLEGIYNRPINSEE